MLTIVGLSGSLRRDSFNTALLYAAAECMPSGAVLDVATLEGIPLYHGDEEAAHGIPGAVAALKDRIAAADALLLATPEYNSGMPGVFKNAIDWLSRPPEDQPRVLHGRPVALMGATPGGGGTGLAQASWLPVFRGLRMRPWFGGRMQVGGAGNLFDDGALTDDATAKQLAEFMSGFVDFVRG